MTTFRVLRGCNFPPGDRRAEPGDLIDNISKRAADALLRLGAIEPVDDEEGDG